MLEAKPIKLKLCLVGECAVGKTSLIRRYVLDQFDDTYIGTIGTKVTKREIKIPHPENGRMVDIHLLIWDIIGEPAFRMLVQESYFFGAQGMIAVCDFTRKDTLSALEGWMESAQGITGEIPTVFLANKCDLEHEQQMELNELKGLASRYEKAMAYSSSAKTGLNVELVFKTLSEKVLEDMIRSSN